VTSPLKFEEPLLRTIRTEVIAPSLPFPRVTLEEAKEMVRATGQDVPGAGHDLDSLGRQPGGDISRLRAGQRPNPRVEPRRVHHGMGGGPTVGSAVGPAVGPAAVSPAIVGSPVESDTEGR